jgi:hypothetical protein
MVVKVEAHSLMDLHFASVAQRRCVSEVEHAIVSHNSMTVPALSARCVSAESRPLSANGAYSDVRVGAVAHNSVFRFCECESSQGRDFL